MALVTLLDGLATVQCPHGGVATPSVTNLRVKLGGSPATTIAAPWKIECPNAQAPCTIANFAPGATRVLLEGQPAVLSNSTGLCPPGGRVLVMLTQGRVEGQ